MIAWRDAEGADAAALAALFAASFTATFGHLYAAEDLASFLAGNTIERWAAELADPGFAIHVGVEDGGLIAFVKLGPPALPVAHSRPAIELRQLYVLASHHGGGAARTAMDWAIATARRRGARDMILSVYIDNPRARRFYQRYGFERIGTYAFMVGNHADEDDLMRLAL